MQRLTGLVDEPGPVVDLHHGVLDERLDLLGRLGASLREAADFRGDHREAAALLARARRLDGGVEGEQIRLERDVVDHRDDLGDLPRRPRDFLHRGHRLGHDLTPRLGRVPRADGEPAGLLGVGRVLSHGPRELLQRGRGLLQGGRLLLRARRQLLGRLGQLLGGDADLRRRLANLADEPLHVVEEGVERARELSGFILRTGVQPDGQVGLAGRQLLKPLRGLPQRTHHQAGDIHVDADAEHQRQQPDAAEGPRRRLRHGRDLLGRYADAQDAEPVGLRFHGHRHLVHAARRGRAPHEAVNPQGRGLELRAGERLVAQRDVGARDAAAVVADEDGVGDVAIRGLGRLEDLLKLVVFAHRERIAGRGGEVTRQTLGLPLQRARQRGVLRLHEHDPQRHDGAHEDADEGHHQLHGQAPASKTGFGHHGTLLLAHRVLWSSLQSAKTVARPSRTRV